MEECPDAGEVAGGSSEKPNCKCDEVDGAHLVGM